jgi:heptosyltransferase III
MPPVLDALPAHARVLVIRLRSLGDCVLTTPALTLLKQFRPDLKISVMVEQRFSAVFTSHPAVTQVLSPLHAHAFRCRADLVINYHGGPRSLLLTLSALARRRAAFAHLPAQWAYNLHIPRAQEILGEDRTVHTAEHLASAMFYLGVPPAPIPRASMVASAPAPYEGRYAVLHPFASTPAKTWPAERFLQLARYIEDNFDLRALFIGGPDDDFTPFRGEAYFRDLDLDRVKTLLARAELFCGNDSGPAHMAAAFGVPVLALFSTSNPEIWSPWRTACEVIQHPAGLADLPWDPVVAALERLRRPL